MCLVGGSRTRLSVRPIFPGVAATGALCSLTDNGCEICLWKTFDEGAQAGGGDVEVASDGQASSATRQPRSLEQRHPQGRSERDAKNIWTERSHHRRLASRTEDLVGEKVPRARMGGTFCKISGRSIRSFPRVDVVRRNDDGVERVAHPTLLDEPAGLRVVAEQTRAIQSLYEGPHVWLKTCGKRRRSHAGPTRQQLSGLVAMDRPHSLLGCIENGCVDGIWREAWWTKMKPLHRSSADRYRQRLTRGQSLWDQKRCDDIVQSTT